MRIPCTVSSRRRADGVIVSLTTFPARVQKVWMVIESLLRQRVAPERIVLVLSLEEFPHRRLPLRVAEQQKRGLEIMWTPDNTRSYKKLLPLRAIYPDSVIVTADDDELYPSWWLSALLEGHSAYPTAIVGLRGTEIIVDAMGCVEPYLFWPPASPDTPPQRVFLKGDGGILYPPRLLSSTLFDYATASRLCPTADDIWFKAMALLSNVPVRRLVSGSLDFPKIAGSQTVSLASTNVAAGGNDRQLRAVFDYFDLWAYV